MAARRQRIERIEPLPPEEETIHFSFPQPKASGRVVVEAKGLAKSYGDKQVFRDARFIIERGERVALVGHNGAGKSTLIRLLSQTEPPTSGELTIGHNVEIDYFAQDQYKALDPEARIFDDLRSQARGKTDTELRSLLGCFLFSDDDTFKRIGVLSGGERNRYALARMLLAPSNFLLLDEPTNHLDLGTREALSIALNEFEGTLLLVSHDRALLREVCDEFWLVWRQDGKGVVEPFDGDLDDYQRWLLEASRAAVRSSEMPGRPAPAPAPPTSAKGVKAGPAAKAAPAVAAPAPAQSPRDDRKAKAQARAKRAEATRPLRIELAQIDKRLEALAAERAGAEAALATGGLAPADIAEHGRRLNHIAAETAMLEERWLELQEQLEASAAERD